MSGFHSIREAVLPSKAILCIGVKFPRLNGELRHRLQELVLKFATFKGCSEGHIAFRLA